MIFTDDEIKLLSEKENKFIHLIFLEKYNDADKEFAEIEEIINNKFKDKYLLVNKNNIKNSISTFEKDLVKIDNFKVEDIFIDDFLVNIKLTSTKYSNRYAKIILSEVNTCIEVFDTEDLINLYLEMKE